MLPLQHERRGDYYGSTMVELRQRIRYDDEIGRRQLLRIPMDTEGEIPSADTREVHSRPGA